MEVKIEEIWKDVPASDRYQVSNTGKVFDKLKNQLLPQRQSKGNYPYVSLRVPPRIKYGIHVHRLVLWAFYGILTSRSIQCNHKDGIKSNNNLSNLEAVTASENTRHAYRTGLNPGAWQKTKDKQYYKKWKETWQRNW